MDEWIARVKARGQIRLEEKQLKFHIERYSNIAHLWSSYVLYSDGKQVARGINSIQLFFDGTRWWTVSIFWDSERPGQAIPEEYLPKK